MEGLYESRCLYIISNELSSFHCGGKCIYRDVWGRGVEWMGMYKETNILVSFAMTSLGGI